MRSSRDLHPGLVALMEAQGGVFTGEQAVSFDHNRADIQRLRTDNPPVLLSVRRGVYAWAAVHAALPATERHRLDVAAVALCLNSNVVFSHQSAAVSLGLDLLDPDLSMVQVTRQPPARPRTEAGVRHHVAELVDAEIHAHRDDLAVTSLARTAVDVARDTDRMECAVAACDSALRMGTSRGVLHDVFDRCRSWPGARLVARAIDLADARAANPGESWSRVVLIQQGVPPDDLQVAVHDDEGLIGYADFGWDGVLGEFDGKGKYGLSAASPDPEEMRRVLWLEKQREDRLRVKNEVVRWTTADLHRPRELAGRVRAAQERARGRRPTYL